ncbi:MAG: dTDP-4-dehydrorhamnose reductase, partial [Alphaproteobacteria bacterium]|nr:dTDP-4-dehydrorhamnose reductase [Alphaproteobacteria bacterium]
GRHMRAAFSELPITALTRRECDIGDTDALVDWLAWAEPQIVINCAAYTRVDDAETDRETAEHVNARGPAALARLCADRQASLVHISTDYVFGGQAPTDPWCGYAPTDQPAPLNHYGATKLDGEEMIRRVLPQHWIIRTSWLFSAHGRNFVRTILRLAAERPELRIVDDQVGTPTWAGHLAAACRALVDAAARGSAPPFGTYHFAGAPAVSWHGFASAIVDAAVAGGQLARPPAVVPITTAEFPRPARRPTDSRLDSSDLLTALGLPVADWGRGLATMIRRPVAA